MTTRHSSSDLNAPTSEGHPAQPINWKTFADDQLVPSASDSIDVEIGKINELARRQRERAVTRRLQKEDEERRRKVEEESRRKEEEDAKNRRLQEEAKARQMAEEAESAKAAVEVSVHAGVDAEEEGVDDGAVAAKTVSRAPSARVSAFQVNRAFALIPSESATLYHGAPVTRSQPCASCITSRQPCFDLPNSRSKQCARCLQQKKGCRLPDQKTSKKRKDTQPPIRADGRRKRTKITGADDDNTQLVGTSMAAAGSSAGTAPDSVAQVLDRRLGEITFLLRGLVRKADESADWEGKGKSHAVVESAEEERDGDADADTDSN
ncbi:hypothetical protein PISMIDRAFT_18405 [Pisolithus microcarpus 441]|uniref:Unplaced genomic scaffold scaffold_355, whole genome shotgun sequence n=1 Tax=Pisolithus microcarpus 441 TaxID=765257 RepID=A0A0C9YRE3_9AGAM|nr:hypothetical protein PISMIDRAFT_18405 [Pisolithus microcarpus 441]